MVTKGNIDQAVYEFKKQFSNNQDFDITFDKECLVISRLYVGDRPKSNKQKTIEEIINNE